MSLLQENEFVFVRRKKKDRKMRNARSSAGICVFNRKLHGNTNSLYFLNYDLFQLFKSFIRCIDTFICRVFESTDR